MRLVKPSWVHHNDNPIYSVDVHQDCTKFATGGQGASSGCVVIWNLQPVLCEKAECDETVPKMLCQMDEHLACVNCVRWSQNGLLLASGSDDKLVMIWRKALGPSGIFCTGGLRENHESWKCIHTLRGHDGDVLDLAWSPNDYYLASCSVDNTIIVWDGRALPNRLHMLKGHASFVKGIAWDPVGNYLASQSDDRTVKVWSTTDWSCSRTITEPFLQCGATTHVLRLSWSPDGQYLVSAHAMNGGGPTAQIIDRDVWKYEHDFVGHRKAVTCVRFHNSILTPDLPGGSPNKTIQYCVLGVGSRDRSLSVWMTSLQRPLVVIHDLFNESILDMSWGPQQRILMACSSDGSVACLQFTEQELGKRVNDNEMFAIIKRRYGSAFENSYVMDRRGVPVLQTGQCQGVSSSPAIKKQTETRTKDGKRRITPMFIPANQLNDPMSIVNMGGTGEPTITSSNSNNNHSNATSGDNSHIEKTMGDGHTTAGMEMEHGAAIAMSSATASMAMSTPSPSSLAAPQIAVNTKCEITKTSHEYRLHVQNGYLKTGYGMVARVTAHLSRELLWDMYSGSPVINVNLCSKYVILCSLDACIRLISMTTGRPILPAISLSSPVAHCTFSTDGHKVGVLATNGQLRIWCMVKQSSNLSVNAHDLLVKHGQELQFSITDQGMPLIGFPNGTSYSYSSNLNAWVVLSTGGDAIMVNGMRGSLPRNLEQMSRKYPLLSMQANTQNYLSLRGSVEIDPESWQQTAKLLFLENQIKLCELLDASEELKHWHIMLIFHLATYGTEKRLRIFLDSLLQNDSEKLTTQQCVPRHELMQCVLSSLKPHTQWEHIYNEYVEIYKNVDEEFDELDDPEPQSSANLPYTMIPSAGCRRTRGAAAAEAALEALLTAEPSSPPPKKHKYADKEDNATNSSTSVSSQPASPKSPEESVAVPILNT